MSKKLIIVFEGIEGAGKSYHINKVAKYLKNNNFENMFAIQGGIEKLVEAVPELKV